jgi:hypothetical protein
MTTRKRRRSFTNRTEAMKARRLARAGLSDIPLCLADTYEAARRVSRRGRTKAEREQAERDMRKIAALAAVIERYSKGAP